LGEPAAPGFPPGAETFEREAVAFLPHAALGVITLMVVALGSGRFPAPDALARLFELVFARFVFLAFPVVRLFEVLLVFVRLEFELVLDVERLLAPVSSFGLAAGALSESSLPPAG